MKALVISPQPFFTPRGTPFSVYYRTLIMAELGVQIDLLTYGQGQDVDLPGVRIIRIPRFSFLGPVKVGPSWLKLFLDQFILLRTIRLLVWNQYDFVHAHEEAVFWAYFLKPIFRFKLVYDMHSSLPQQLTNFEFSKSRWLARFFKKMEDACLKKAEAVITICPDLFDYVNTIIDNPRKHFLIENSIFDDVRIGRASPSGVPEKAEEDSLPLPQGRKRVVYAGTLEPYQGIDLLIQAFAQMFKQDQDALLLIVGGRPEQVEHYRKLALEMGLKENCLFTGRVSQKLAKLYTGQADVLVSPRSRGTNTPLKIYEQLQSGIPLVATAIYSHTQVLTPEVAFLVKPEAGDLARGLLLALKKDRTSQDKCARARALYEEKYARQVYKNKMRQLLEYVNSCAG